MDGGKIGGDGSNRAGLRSNRCVNNFEIQAKTNHVLRLYGCMCLCVYNIELTLFNCSHGWPFFELLDLIIWKMILIKILKHSTNPQLKFKTISKQQQWRQVLPIFFRLPHSLPPTSLDYLCFCVENECACEFE